MTIQDIAKLANVSISTVSKIMNNKDKNISAETRERVLQIVKQNNYMPYAKHLSSASRSSLLLGVLFGHETNPALLNAIMLQSRARGYSPIMCCAASAEQERENCEAILSHYVNSILWCKEAFSSKAVEDAIYKNGIPLLTINLDEAASDLNITLPFAEFAELAVKTFIEHGHQRIGCIVPQFDPAVECFLNGFRQGASRCGMEWTDDDICQWEDEGDRVFLFLESHSAAVCYDEKLALKACNVAESLNLRITKDLSLITLGSVSEDYNNHTAIIEKNYEQLGSLAIDLLVNKIEKLPPVSQSSLKELHLKNEEWIGSPQTEMRTKIVIVGASNMDTLGTVNRLPELGETVEMFNRIIVPGGKGMNQALAVARLEADAYLISSLGRDYDGGQILEQLKKNNVNTTGIFFRANMPTGHAYIQIQKNGEGYISIFNAANHELSTEDLDTQKHLFQNSAYCLLQTELKQEIATHAANIAHECGAKVILKPCAISVLDKELMEKVDILIPNEKEAAALLPGLKTVEERAQYFFDAGIPTVIITLGKNGCYLKDANYAVFSPAIDITSVDTTGAADGFIATLAVYLSRKHDIIKSIYYATCAAGLVTTRYGVPPALVDLKTLEMFTNEQFGGLK